VDQEKHCNKQPKIRIVQHTTTGGLWVAAWLFTIGFLKLTFWKSVWAVVIWPYYLGTHWSPK
jgi:hypothetical protein